MYAAILGIAAVGLAVDRLVLGSSVLGPAGAEAGEAPPDPPAAAAPAARTQENMAPSDLAERLQALRDHAATEDRMASVLSVPANWFEAECAELPDVDGPEAAAAKREYKVTAIAAGSGEMSFAVVNRRRLQVGDTLDGMKLIEIHGRQVVFQAGSENVVLTMDLPMKAAQEPVAGENP